MRLLIISIPLLSSLSLIVLGRQIGHKGGKIISIGSIIISVIVSIISLKEYLEGKIYTIEIKEWFNIGHLVGRIEVIYDKESIIMINLISVITMVVIIYSYWYLSKDAHINRFISKLLIFAVTMYILVTSKNLLFSFFGWEGVGIISFLLINFWSNSIQNSKSAIKAIIFNKIGDIFYLFALMIITFCFYSFDYSYLGSLTSPHTILSGVEINYFENNHIWGGLTQSSYGTYREIILVIISISLLIAAMAKSAQIFLHSWLGDAMAGPTPVSALLHAATMVTAGIFLIIRTKVIIFESNSIIQSLILIIGSLTIIFAGISSLNQYDIKKVIAYSTCGQIGFMFFALALFKPIDSSIYHLVTHGFFKALLFLSAGLLIHSFLYEQDLRKYGNLLFNSPLFYLFFFIGSLAIIAFPPFSGFFSKDLILFHSLNYPIYYYIILLFGSLLSSLYSFKILFYAFFNSSLPFSQSKFLPLSNPSFLYSFFFLLLGSIFFGFISTAFFSSPESLNLTLESTLSTNVTIKLITLSLPFLAIFLIIFEKLVASNYLTLKPSIYKIIPLGTRKFFFDTFYNYFFVKPLFFLSYHISFKFLDRGLLEYLGPISLFRLFFFFPKHFNLNNQLSTNTPFLFFYFFISFLSLFFLFWLLGPSLYS